MAKVKSFDKLGVHLSDPVLQTLKELGFDNATPIQAECIPYLLKNRDVAAEAVTGSGKTVAFVIPMIEMLLKREVPLKKKEVGGLIISPTRELATQTHQVISKFLLNVSGIVSLLIVGGNPIQEDINNLRNGCNIITATPGRLEELLTKNFPGINLLKSLKELEFLVLDEADKLLDLGFEKSLNTILRYLPTQRRTGLFSATQTKQLAMSLKAGLRNPLLIEVKEKQLKSSNGGPIENASTPVSLTNYYMMCEPDRKLTMLVNFVRKKGIDLKYMVFFSSCACVDYFLTVFRSLLSDVTLFGLHGKMKDRRYKIFDKFKASESGIMLCTDVMARGVDIPEVHWVVQFDPPSSATSFVHRSGRTARIGRTGNALIMLMPNEDAYVNFILRNQKVLLKKMKPIHSENKDDIVNQVRQIQINDRQVFDKANRAFVSYIQSYTKHECNLILRVKDLDICKLALGFGLLKLPKMPELKKVDVSEFVPVDMDPNDIKYTNKQREETRVRKLEQYRETGVWPKIGAKQRRRMKQTESWADSKQRKAERKERRKMRKELKKKSTEDGNVKKKRKRDISQEEMDELMKDIELLRKHKKGKITDEEFNAEFVTDSN